MPILTEVEIDLGATDVGAHTCGSGRTGRDRGGSGATFMLLSLG